MARRNRTPEEAARRAKIRELLQESNISSMADIQNLFKEAIAEFMENGLDAELEDELGYSRYDYRNKETDNSRNGHRFPLLWGVSPILCKRPSYHQKKGEMRRRAEYLVAALIAS